MKLRHLVSAAAAAAALVVATTSNAAAAETTLENDAWQGAFELAPPDFHFQNTQEATADTDEIGLATGCGWGSDVRGSVWYKYTAAENGTLSVDAAFSDYFVNVVVTTRQGDGWGPATCAATRAQLDVTAGTTYYVLFVAAAGSAPSALQFYTSNFVSSVDVSETAEFSRGKITAHGALSCESGQGYVLIVSALQVTPAGQEIRGSDTQTGTCTSTQVAWTATMAANEDRFRLGRETLVSATLNVCRDTCNSIDDQAVVTLKHA